VRKPVLAIAALLLATCTSGGDDGPGGPSGSIAIAVAPGTLDLAAGASGTVTVTVTRSGGFAGAVNLAVTGLPTGVTMAAAAIAAGATSATLTVQAAAATAAATSTVTVTGSASGVSNATGTFSLAITASAAGGFTLALSPTSLTVPQGSSGTTTVTITKTAPFTGAVALSATGLPSGVTAAFDPSSVTGGTSTLTLTASGSAATGSHTITVRGAGTGVSDQSATLALTVNQASSGGNVVWPVCPGGLVPIWFAYQDGTGPWTPVNVAGNAFRFSVSQSRAGIAYVTQNPDGSFSLSVLYFAASELPAQATSQCAQTGSKTVNGSVAGLSGTQQAGIALGNSFASVLPGAPPTFTLNLVRDGVVDLLASRSILTINGTSVTTTTDKLIFRRGLNPASGSTLPLLDFGSTEAFDPVTRNITINNLMGESSIVGMWYHTSNGFVNSFFGGFPASGGTQTYPGVPAARQQAGDLHAMQLAAGPYTSSTIDRLRFVLAYFAEATDRTVTLGPQLNTPTVSTAATAPYVRWRVQLAVQPEYDKAWTASWSQAGTGGNARTAVISATVGYLGSAPATVELVIPDFASVTGWNNTWGPRTGVQAQYTVAGTDWTAAGGALSGPVSDGGMIFGASRLGVITP
jgi:hypothetical protein